MSLTDYLGDNDEEDFDYPETLPPHPTFPHKTKPDELIIYPMRECRSCPQLGGNDNPGHITYERGELSGPINKRPATLPMLRNLQWLVSKACAWFTTMYGSQSGLLLNGLNTTNFADFQDYNILSVDGDTLTCEKLDGSNCGDNAWGTLSFFPEGSQFKVTHVLHGLPQPNDEIEFLSPSVLATKSRPSILRVIWTTDTPNQIQFVCDQSVTHAMTLGDESAAPYSGEYHIKVWRQNGDREEWNPVNDPKELRCYSKFQVIDMATDLDADGVIELTNRDGDPCRIAIPVDASGIFGASWKTTAYLIAGGASVLDTKSRVRIVQSAGAWNTYLCLGTKDHTGATVFGSDLRDTVSRLVLSFMPEAPPDYTAWKASCAARCKHDTRDYHNSEITAPGFGADADDNRWYCKQVNTVVYDDVQNMDGTWTTTESFTSPSHIAEYNPGSCYMNVCDQFSVVTANSGNESTWSWWRSWTSYVQRITAAANIYLVQLFPAISSYHNLKIGRGHGPSTRSLMGPSFSMRTPEGMHPSVLAMVDEAIVSGYNTITVDGDEDFVPVRGANYDPDQDWSEIEFGVDQPADGLGVQSGKKQILAPTVNEGDAQDTHRTRRAHEDEIGGATCKQDEFTLGGRSYADTPVATTVEPLIVPRVSLDATSDQNRNEVVVQKHETHWTIMGEQYSHRMQIMPIRPPEKDPVQTGTGTVQDVEDLGGGEFKIVLENQQHHFSTIQGTSGDRHDEIISFMAGGNVGCPPHLKINNYYETDKTIGSGTHPVWIGDSVKILATVSNDSEFDERAFLVTHVEPHGVSNADWGQEIITHNWTVTGYWEPTDNATLEDVVVLDSVQLPDTTPLTRLTTDARPSVINTGEYWFDTDTNRIYFSGADFGDAVNIYWDLETAETSHSQLGYVIGTPNIPPHHVAAESYVDTGVTSSTLASYDGYSVEYVTGGALALVGSNPGIGEYSESFDASTHLLLTFNRAESGARVSVIFDTGEPASNPGDIARIPDYGTWGAYRDYLIIKDDVDGFIANAIANGGLIGEPITYWQSQQVFVPSVAVSVTPYLEDAYVSVPAGDYLEESGQGYIYLKKSWADAQTDRTLCFKIDIKRMDLRGLPTKRCVDGLMNQVQLCGQGFQAVGSGPTLPLIEASIGMGAGFPQSAYAPKCDDPGFPRWEVLKGSVYVPGITPLGIRFAYDRANFNRHAQIVLGNQFASGYGFVNLSDCDGPHMLLAGSTNHLNQISGRRFNGSVYALGTYYWDGSVDPDDAPDIPVYIPDPGENWTARGAGQVACPVYPYPQSHYFTDIRGPGFGGSGPGIHGIIENEGLYSFTPFHDVATLPSGSLGLNYLGAIGPELIGQIESHNALMSIGGGPSFTLPILLQKLPTGSTILEAKVRIRISALHKWTATVEGTIDEDGVVTYDSTLTDDPTSVGLALLAGKIVDPALGTMQYDVIAAGVGSGVTSDKWSIMDCTDIMQLMLDQLRDSAYYRMALVPAPSVAAFGSINNPKAVLGQYLPVANYETWVHPDNTTLWHGGSDVPYQTSWSGSWATWTGIQYGNLWIKFQVPNSSKTRVIQYFDYPVFAPTE